MSSVFANMSSVLNAWPPQRIQLHPISPRTTAPYMTTLWPSQTLLSIHSPYTIPTTLTTPHPILHHPTPTQPSPLRMPIWTTPFSYRLSCEINVPRRSFLKPKSWIWLPLLPHKGWPRRYWNAWISNCCICFRAPFTMIFVSFYSSRFQICLWCSNETTPPTRTHHLVI